MVTEKLCNLLECVCHENEETEPVHPAQMNIHQSNTYRKDLSWLHVSSEPRVHERLQAEDQKPFIPAIVAYQTYPSSS